LLDFSYRDFAMINESSDLEIRNLARALDDYLAWQQRQAECSRTASVRSPTQAAGAKESR